MENYQPVHCTNGKNSHSDKLLNAQVFQLEYRQLHRLALNLAQVTIAEKYSAAALIYPPLKLRAMSNSATNSAKAGILSSRSNNTGGTRPSNCKVL